MRIVGRKMGRQRGSLSGLLPCNRAQFLRRFCCPQLEHLLLSIFPSVFFSFVFSFIHFSFVYADWHFSLPLSLYLPLSLSLSLSLLLLSVANCVPLCIAIFLCTHMCCSLTHTHGRATVAVVLFPPPFPCCRSLSRGHYS